MDYSLIIKIQCGVTLQVCSSVRCDMYLSPGGTIKHRGSAYFCLLHGCHSSTGLTGGRLMGLCELEALINEVPGEERGAPAIP